MTSFGAGFVLWLAAVTKADLRSLMICEAAGALQITLMSQKPLRSRTPYTSSTSLRVRCALCKKKGRPKRHPLFATEFSTSSVTTAQPLTTRLRTAILSHLKGYDNYW